MRIIFISVLLSVYTALAAQRVADNAYWFYFSDKKNNAYTVESPLEFLTLRSVERRAWQSLPITERDLPVMRDYLDSLSSLGLEIAHVSKWLNGALVFSENLPLIDSLHKLSFIDTIPWEPDPTIKFQPGIPAGSRFPPPLAPPAIYKYGSAIEQIKMMNLDFLHNKGYSGKGVMIAVLDGGFIDLPNLSAFKVPLSRNQVIATRNFVNKNNEVYNNHAHGTYVTSIIIGNLPDSLIGAAPDADLLLATTENVNSETKIEEYAWIAGAEWADSLGADIINTSLGYTTFDDSNTDYTYVDMDGKTAPISIAISLTSSMGMVSITSAGNSGNDPWHYIGAPADAENILSVGAVNRDRVIADFSSRGPSFDRRIKPEISAMGSGTTFQSPSGIMQGNGTSFSAPLITGAIASLWQAYPTMSADELMNWVIKSSDQSKDPDIHYGFGIPSFSKAFHTITSMPVFGMMEEHKIIVYPNPVHDRIHYKTEATHHGTYKLKIYDLQGRVLFEKPIEIPGETIVPAKLQSGIYILEFSNSFYIFKTKIIRN